MNDRATHRSRCASLASVLRGHDTSTSSSPSFSPRFPTARKPAPFNTSRSFVYWRSACLAFSRASRLGRTLAEEERKTRMRSTSGAIVGAQM